MNSSSFPSDFVTQPPSEPPKRVGPRILTALVGIPLVLLVVWLGGAVFRLFCLILALGAMRELQVAFGKSNRAGGAKIIGTIAYPAIFVAVWHGLSSSFPWGLLVALLTISVLLFGRATRLTLLSVSVTMLATLYVSIFALLPTLRAGGDGELFYLALFSVWASDTAAYYGGRALGKSPFSPLSPGKTREGALCGAGAAIIVAAYIASRAGFPLFQCLMLGFIVAVAAPLGDLAESFWKRELGVKDMGAVFPGHGGILDRCDSLLFAVLALFLYFAWLSP
ncbi:MAG TPA: phosphatidate cytidylyltransferase [Abditibacterium sp.]|jgi:phosphatidate cytidylyltransferase